MRVTRIKRTLKFWGGDGQVLTTFGPEKYELEHVTGTEKLNVRLNEDGLREINTTYKETAKKLKLSFAASVIQAGELKNEATVITNNGNGQGDTETKTNETVSYWATVKIVKKDGTGEKTLQGAIFALYGSKDAVCSKDDLVERNKISTGSGGEKVQKTQDTWETNGEGVAIINGLHVNDWDDNSPVSDDQYRAYCLVEKQAPQGYELLSKPIQLELKKTNASTFSASTTDKAVDVQATKTIDVYEATATVKNVEDKTPNLPMTGGAGVGILAAIGAAIIGAGAWFARRNSAES